MSRRLRTLFEIVLKAAFALFGIGGYDKPTEQELGDAQATQARRIAEVGASPADRGLARALIRSGEMPPGIVELGRGWTPLDPSEGIVVSVKQHLAERPRRLRRSSGSQLLLELSRYRSEEAASEAIAPAPTRTLPDGQRMREREMLEAEEIRIFEWSRREDWQTAERVMELRLQRGSAVAILLATSDAPTPEWERQTIELMRGVGERLR